MRRKMRMFCLLLWKNFRLLVRKPLLTMIKFLLPLAMVLVVVIVKFAKPDPHSMVVYPSYCAIQRPWTRDFCGDEPDHLSPINHGHYKIPTLLEQIDLKKRTLTYCPTNIPFVNKAMEGMKKYFVQINSAESCTAFEGLVSNNQDDNMLAGLEFLVDPAGDQGRSADQAPAHIDIKLRFSSALELSGNKKTGTKLWVTHERHTDDRDVYPGPRKKGLPIGEYTTQGFITVMGLVTYELTKAHDPNFNFPEVRMRRFPYPRWTNEINRRTMRNLLVALTGVGFIFMYVSIVQDFVMEKATNLKVAMKVMGVPNAFHWMARFTSGYFVSLVVAAEVCALLTVRWFPVKSVLMTNATKIEMKTALMETSPYLVFIFLMVYSAAVLTCGFAMAALFSRITRATIVAILVFILSFMPYVLFTATDQPTPVYKQIISCLCMNSAMGLGWTAILKMEYVGEGYAFNNFWKKVDESDCPLGYVIVMLAIDAVWQMLFSLYVIAVFPEDESTPLFWCFFLTKKFWFPQRHQPQQPIAVIKRPDDIKSVADEEAPPNRAVSVEIIHLRKIHRGDIVAVKDLNMKIYDGQVTVIIGQANAGKTTVMRLLAGISTPTSGTATIYGYDLTKDIGKIRHALGFCSRKNIIYNSLSIEDNLKFFSLLRGVPRSEVAADVTYYIQLLRLESERKKLPKRLQPDDLRKLSIAAAFCGRAKLILLDEPSYGLKFSGKRRVWNLINVLKRGRTVIVNTLFMDEAEALGDRIAIMAAGELQFYGSIGFLKRKYGIGYYLHVRVKPMLDVPTLTGMLRFYITELPEPEVLENDNGRKYEVHYTLPKAHSDVFAAMLAELEGTNGKNIGVTGFDVTVISTGETFLKIITHQHRKAQMKEPVKAARKITHRRPMILISGVPLVFNHIMAMFMKRVLVFSRNLRPFFFMLFAIVFILWFAMSEVKNYSPFTIMPSLDLSPNDALLLLNDLKHVDPPMDENKYAKDIMDNAAKQFHVQVVDDIVDAILRERTTNNLEFNHGNTMIAMSVQAPRQNRIRLNNWYSENFYHTEGTAAAVGFSLVYQSATGGRTIRFYNHPFSLEIKIEDTVHEEFSRYLQVTVLLSLITSLVAAYFAMFYVMEAATESKFLQMISGVTVWVFLLVRFICDYTIYLITALILLLLLALFQKQGFNTIDNLYEVFLLLVSYGFVAIPMMHMISKAYKSPGSAVLKVTTFNFITGLLPFILMWVFDQMGSQTLHQTKRVFLIWPFYTMTDAFQHYQKITMRETACRDVIKNCREVQQDHAKECIHKYCNDSGLLGFTCCEEDEFFDAISDFFAMSAMGEHLVHFYSSGGMLILLVFLTEYRCLRKLSWTLARMCTRTKPRPEQDEDKDVLRERIKISKFPASGANYPLVLKDLTKNYGDTVIVNGLCVGVKKGECFGVLGPTNSGKSTVFRLITGEARIGFGSVYILGESKPRIVSKLIRKYTGYCPQRDPLLADMTVRETIVMHALIKGVRMRDTIRLAGTLAKDLEFTEYLHKKNKHLSCGNRRKVSIALSLLGKPKIIFMDEPTLGMDPYSKKVVWKVLTTIRDRGTAILLTTHSMAEGQALCNRMAILIQGTFNAMGSMKLLKEKFSKGYTVTIRLKPCADLDDEMEKMEDIEACFEENFNNVILIERHTRKMTFFTEDANMLCSDMFKEMEKLKSEYHVKEYTIGQSKLEQVFLYFTRRQGA